MRLNQHRWIAMGIATIVAGGAGAVEAPTPDPAKLEFFEKKVRPILANHCTACHDATTKPAGGLRVDDLHGLLTGGNSGKAIVPGKPQESLLLKRVKQDGKRKMPLDATPLTDEQTADLTKWIADGAVWPPVAIPASLGRPRPKYEELKKDHWSWQPVTAPAVPAVKDAAWAKDDIDRFILAKLEAKNFKPVGDADKLALVRRITFDLTGLPPTPAEIDAFVNDQSAGAFAKVVDRLLASPQFGERWGRHWLDVARYGESTGPSRNIPYPHAWKYRDYVIDSVNADVPYNRFITEQVAGDLLPGSGDREKVATGFLALGVKDVNQRFKVRFIMDNVDEQIDAVTRSVLGLTVSCARCHDHKFDPVPQADYYALAGIFTSTDNASGVRNQMGGSGLAYYVPDMLVKLGSSGSLPTVDPEKLAKLKADVEEAKQKWDSIRGTPEGLKPGPNGQPTQRPFRVKYERLQNELNDLTVPKGPMAHGVRDAKEIADTAIRVRGEAEKLGPVVPRGFLNAFPVPGAPELNRQQSGRLELAAWLASDKNPLTGRVYVNRVWAHLFGRGIVSTVDNFGVNGDVPANPELLDHLVQRFQADGQSLKKLVRTIVLTRAYQLSSESTFAHTQANTSNSLVWRHSPRRLDAEEFRDAALAAAGKLDTKRPEGSPASSLRMVEMRDNGPEAKAIHDAADASVLRSIYLPLLRGVTPKTIEVFDPVDQTLVSGSRESTTVPSQALFLLNSAFIRKQSLALAERLLKEAKPDGERIATAYRLTLGRTPSDTEIARVSAFLTEYEQTARADFAKAPAPKKVDPKKVDKPKGAEEPPLDPDQIDQTGEAVTDERVDAKDAKTAAWLAFVQALYGSAEFRFVR